MLIHNHHFDLHYFWIKFDSSYKSIKNIFIW